APPDHAHHLIHRHPWAQYVTLNSNPIPSDPAVVTSAVPLDLYSHIPPGGYLAGKYVRRLFPHFFKEEPSPTRRISFFELMRLELPSPFEKTLRPSAGSRLRITCDFPLSSVEQDEIVAAHVRRNVSCAIRFSEFPVSKAARKLLCSFVRNFLPAHPDEGILPLRVFKLTQRERDWITRRMTHLFNAACSALAAVNLLNDDKRTHMLTSTIPRMDAYPVRFDFTIEDMSSECGWTNQRPVYLWIVGAQSLTQGHRSARFFLMTLRLAKS
ncbi:hypothetical protein COOONC_02316, partial [Cooperia oncophora]